MTRINVVMEMANREDAGSDAAFLASMLHGMSRTGVGRTWAIAVDDEFLDGQGIDPQELIIGIPGRVERH